MHKTTFFRRNGPAARERIGLLLCAFLWYAHAADAQKKYGQELVDSLLAELPKVQADSDKVKILAEVCYRYDGLDNEAGFKYGNQALALATQINWEEGVALSKENIGRMYWRNGHYDTALQYHNAALAHWERSGKRENAAFVCIFIAQDYGDSGNYLEALKYLNRALDEYRALGQKRGQRSVHNILSWVYGNMGMHAEALEHQFAYLRLAEETGDQEGVALALNNLSGMLRDEGKYEAAIALLRQSINSLEKTASFINLSLTYSDIGFCYAKMSNYPEALRNYQKALEIGQRIHNANCIGAAYSGMGNVHSAQGGARSALRYYLLATDYFQAVDNASLYSKIGVCYVKTGDYAAAQQYFDQAWALCQKTNSISDQKNYYAGVTQLDSATGHWQQAFEHHKQFVAACDSMYNEKNTQRIIQTRMQYEFDKKTAATRAEQEKKDALAQQELERQKLIRNGFIGGFAVVMLFAGVFFYQRNRIKKGKRLSDELLLNILPAEVAEELKAKGSAEAKQIDEVTVLFSDFREFTQLSETLTPRELVAEINECFSTFDRIMQKHGVEKIKTIGDAYMAAGGVPSPNTTHAADVLNAALEMQEFMQQRKQQRESEGVFFFEARIGVHTGPVVAGIVGVKKFAYDIWGDTVNTAQRMESTSEAGRVNISSRTYEIVKTQFQCTYRGKVNTKGKGEVDMYFVEG